MFILFKQNFSEFQSIKGPSLFSLKQHHFTGKVVLTLALVSGIYSALSIYLVPI